MAITFTARTLTAQVLQTIGALGQGETSSDADAQLVLTILNGILDDFGTQRLTLPALNREVFTFTASTNTYTIGPTGTWTTTRPSAIDAMSVLALTATPNFEIPMTALDDQSYAAITIKALTIPFPYAFWYNATFPNGTIYVYPTPTDIANYQAVVYSPTLLTTFATLDTSSTLPPGYYRMLLYVVAREAAIPFAKAPDPRIEAFAEQALTNIKRMNLEPLDLVSPMSLPGSSAVYNIYGDVNL